MMTVDEIFSYLRSIAPEGRDVVTDELFNGKELMFQVREARAGGREAAVRTPGSRWFSVEIEELYDYTVADEDADDDEMRGYLQMCIRVAEAYVRGGGIEERKGLLRSRSIVVSVDGAPFRLEKIIGRRMPR